MVSYLQINDNHVIYMYGQYLLYFVEHTHIECEKVRWQVSVREPIAKGLCHFGAKHVWKFSGCKNQYLDIIIVVIYLFCSFCDDFDLCERCEQKPRQFVHDRKHLFIKLKRPAEQRVPKGRVLDDVCEPTCCI